MHYYKRLRDLREDSDRSQQEIADILGITQVQYYRYESGQREMPFHLVIQLAKYYSVSIDYISDLTNDKRGITVSELSAEETELIKRYRSLGEKKKGRLLERLDVLSDD